MPKPKSIVVKSGQNVELSASRILNLGGMMLDLRPRTADALKTLLMEVGSKSARLQDSDSYEQIRKREDYRELLPDNKGRVYGFSLKGLRAMVRALPAGDKMPKTIELPIFQSGGSRVAAKERLYETRYLAAYSMTTIAIPDWLQNFRVFSQVARFEDIIVEPGGLLTIDYPTITARNLVLHAGSKVKQRVSSLTLDLAGSFRVLT